MRRRTWIVLARCVGVMVLSGGLIIGIADNAFAQFFNSGSSGTHGAFPPVPSGGMPATYSAIVWNVRTGHVLYCGSYTLGTGLEACDGASQVGEAQIPNIPSGGLVTGVYEFTNVLMEAVSGQHRNIVVVGASPNVPLTILSQTDISIVGGAGFYANFMIRGWDGRTPNANAPNLSVVGGRGGPGGFDGGASGNGGSTPGSGSPGIGPSGGQGGNAAASTSAGLQGVSAQASGLNPSLTPLTGGSGGGGGAGVGPSPQAGCAANPTGLAGGGGGGGGGAVLFAATNRFTLNNYGIIAANGGQGGSTYANCGYGGGGAGGSVRIVATEMTGTGQIVVDGGVRGDGLSRAAGGFVRFESTFNTYTGTISGSSGGSFISFPTAPIPATLPQLRISAVNSTASPTNPTASLASPDISFGSPIELPVTLDVTATNVPLGTTVNIRVAPAVGSPSTATTSGLAGTVASSTAQATVTLPPGAGVITATATFNVTSGQSAGILPGTLPLIDGQKPEQVEVLAMADGSSKTFLVARSGARFEVGQVMR